MARVYFNYPVKSVEDMFDVSAMRTLDDVRTALALYDAIHSTFASDKDEEVRNTFDVQFMLARRCIEKRFDRDECVKLFDYVAYCHAWGDVHNLDYDPITLGQMEQIQHKRDEELFALNRELDEDHIDEFNALVNKIRDIWNGRVDGVSTVGMCEIATCDALMDAVEWDGLTTGYAYLAWEEAKVSCEWDVIVDAFHSHADYHKFDYVAVRGF